MKRTLLIAALLLRGTLATASCGGVEMCVRHYAAHYHVSPEFISALIDVESGWNPRALSPKRAMGLMQLMPATARRFGAFDPFNVEQNIAAGTRYVTVLMWEFHGDLRLVAAAYYSGDRNIARKQLDYRIHQVKALLFRPRQVQLQAEEYSLSVARNDLAVAKLNLARAIGLPLGQEFDLADQLPYSDVNPLSLEDALATAYQSRSDLRAALNSEKTAGQSVSAAKAERYPVVAAGGNYGVEGTTFGHSHGEFSFQAGVSIPLFTGGRIRGDIVQAEAAHHQRKSEAENLRGQIDYDVRTSLLNLNAAREQVAVARKGVDLASDSLNRSRDRFSSGVTDSVEVVQAQQALANANDQYITSLYYHNLAKLSLARSIGLARSKYDKFLGGN